MNDERREWIELSEFSLYIYIFGEKTNELNLAWSKPKQAYIYAHSKKNKEYLILILIILIINVYFIYVCVCVCTWMTIFFIIYINIIIKIITNLYIHHINLMLNWTNEQKKEKLVN